MPTKLNFTADKATDNSCPAPLPLSTGTTVCLPTSEIKNETLKSPNDVLLVNYKLRVPSKISTLAVKLARDAYFGDHVLERCFLRYQFWNFKN